MTFLHSIILGIVEGITEFLPISSTGHLIVTSRLLGLLDSEFMKSFEIFIQLGAILAVVVFYRRTIFDLKKINVWKKVLAAFIPTGILGLILYKLVKQYLLGNVTAVILSLIIGGVILIVFEMWQSRKGEEKYHEIEDVPYLSAITIGVAQIIAVIPGVSRSGTTIVAGRLLKLSKKTIVDFSFLLSIPVMVAASGLDLFKSRATLFSDSHELSLLAVGFIVSFIVALGVIKWLLSYVQKHSFIAFGVYRILAGLLFFFLFF
ncbi:MAG: undecaprenyl-diphosphate phosphatase [Candidatus Paceibacterota bacterium]|jgi:undecaprenyl-diphosphatase